MYTTNGVVSTATADLLPLQRPGEEASPPPLALNLLRLTEAALHACFWLSWPAAATLLAVWGATDGGPAPLILAIGLATAAVCAVQLVLYLTMALLAVAPSLQGLLAFGHPCKYLPMVQAAGPFDTGARLLGRRDVSRPACAGLAHARNVRMRTRDGESIGAWHVLPSGGAARRAAARVAAGEPEDNVFDAALRDEGGSNMGGDGLRVAVYLHGMGEMRTKWVGTEHAKWLSAQLNFHVVLPDYRGFADSSGSPSEAGLCADAAAALEWLGARGVKNHEVLLWCHSLGTGVGTQLARECQQVGAPLGGLVLEGAYTSLGAAAAEHPAGLVFRALPGGAALVRRLFAFGFASIDVLPGLTLPTLLLHGTHDAMVPVHHADALAVAAGAPSAPCAARLRFVRLRGCDHLHVIFQPQLLGVLDAWLREVVTPPPVAAARGAVGAAAAAAGAAGAAEACRM